MARAGQARLPDLRALLILGEGIIYEQFPLFRVDLFMRKFGFLTRKLRRPYTGRTTPPDLFKNKGETDDIFST